jgi:hypothetical protein
LDEYHEVMLVGWGRDDLGKSCWIIQNSYGPRFNDMCGVSASAQRDSGAPEWLVRVSDVVEQAYLMSGLESERGCVMIEMVNPELLEHDLGSALENNAIGFIPRLASSHKPPLIHAGRPAARAGSRDHVTSQSVGEVVAAVVILVVVVSLVVAISVKSRPSFSHSHATLPPPRHFP